MLVQRWGMLRSIMPLNITIRKTIALVNALAKLHNFCIDQNEADVPKTSGRDRCTLMMNPQGYIPLDVNAIPTQLLDSGNHFEDVPRESRDARRRRPGELQLPSTLPRTLLLQKVIDSHRVRPPAT